MIRRRSLWLLLGVFLVSAILRIGIAGRSDLWADELFSLATATGHSLEHPAAAARPELGDFVESDHPVSPEEFRRYLKHDVPPAGPARVVRAVFLSDTSPPLYYLLLYAWTLVFGTSDVALRLLSSVFSLACLPLLVGVARRTGEKGAIIPSCVLFTFSPVGIYYSTEGRMYSLLWVCVLATTWLSLVLHQRGGSLALHLLWVAASVAGFLTHYFFVFPWLAVVGLLAIRPVNFSRTRLGGCLVLTCVTLLPWYRHLPESLSSWRITKDWLTWQPPHFRWLTATRELVMQFFSSSGHRTTIVTLILFAIIGAVLLWQTRVGFLRWPHLFIALPFAAACAGPVVFDLARHTYTVAVPRYAIAALPNAYLLAALGLAWMGVRTRTVMVALIVLAWIPNLFSIFRDRSPWSPIREVARSASENGTTGDLILVHSIPSGALGIARYVTGPAAIASWVGQLGDRRVPESIHSLAAGRTRILFVKVHEVGEPAPEEDWLRANATVVRETRLSAAALVEFRPKDAATF